MSAGNRKIVAIAVSAAAVVGVAVWLGVHALRDSDVLPGDAESAKSSVPGSLGKLATGNVETGKYTGPALTGMVKTPTGAPVNGARVMVATGRNPVVMTLDGPAEKDFASASCQTGTDGRFTVQPDARPRAVFVRCPQGYALATIPGSATSGAGPVQVTPLTLQPWGRVEAGVGSAVEAGSRFDCWLDTRFAQAGVFFGINTSATAGARLTLDQVPPGKFLLGVRAGRQTDSKHSYELEVRGGQTAAAQIGLPGRVVVGRVDKPVVGFAMRRATLSRNSPSVTELVSGSVERDGTFRLEGVPPGQYLLLVSLWASTGQSYEPAGDGRQNVEVPASESIDGKPADLGVVAVNIPERLGIGQRAREIEGNDAAGKTVRLSQFRGRYVLVSVTGEPGSAGWKDVVGLKTLFDRFGDDARLAMVTAYTGSAAEKARAQAGQEGVSWPVIDCGASADAVPGQFVGTKHSITIVDRQGVVLAGKVDVPGAWAVLDAVLKASPVAQPAGVRVQTERLPPGEDKGNFRKIAVPSSDDAATRAAITVVDGALPDGPDPRPCLNDGKMPADNDSRDQNFRFAIGTLEGRVGFDLGGVVTVAEIRSYSWHTDTRAPQVYRVFGSDGSGADFDASPKIGKDPARCGWTLIADVDTRPAGGPAGGKYAVSVTRNSGSLGRYRYLLFEMFPTESDDGNGNTFYSEIDVVAAK